MLSHWNVYRLYNNKRNKTYIGGISSTGISSSSEVVDLTSSTPDIAVTPVISLEKNKTCVLQFTRTWHLI
jgi:hypothetical protein